MTVTSLVQSILIYVDFFTVLKNRFYFVFDCFLLRMFFQVLNQTRQNQGAKRLDENGEKQNCPFNTNPNH